MTLMYESIVTDQMIAYHDDFQIFSHFFPLLVHTVYFNIKIHQINMVVPTSHL